MLATDTPGRRTRQSSSASAYPEQNFPAQNVRLTFDLPPEPRRRGCKLYPNSLAGDRSSRLIQFIDCAAEPGVAADAECSMVGFLFALSLNSLGHDSFVIEPAP
jgi:hypothetical protein